MNTFDESLFPIIQRVNSNSIASELVTVKPMSAPIGMKFYTDFQFKEPIKTANPFKDKFKDFYDENY